MRKLIGITFSFFVLCLVPLLAHAEDSYDVTLQGFYWGTNIKTPLYSGSSASYGADFDVRFKKGSSLENWGFEAEYTRDNNFGPRFVNTGGVLETTAGNFSGFPVSLGGGSFGLVSPGGYQLGGGKVKYFLPVSFSKFNAAIYGDYLGMTGGRNAWGGGAEVSWNFADNFTADAWADLNNVTGNVFPAQNLFRFQSTIAYDIPDAKINVFAGYRSYGFSKFFNTSIAGYIIGVGTRF